MKGRTKKDRKEIRDTKTPSEAKKREEELISDPIGKILNWK